MCIIFPDFYIIYIHRLTFTIGLRLDEIITEYTVWNGGAQKKFHAIKYILSYAILFHLHYFPLLLLLCITGEVWLRGGSSRVGSRTVWVLCNRPHFFFRYMHLCANTYTQQAMIKWRWWKKCMKHWMAVVGHRANKQKRTWKFFINKLMHSLFPVPYKFFHNNTITSTCSVGLLYEYKATTAKKSIKIPHTQGKNCIGSKVHFIHFYAESIRASHSYKLIDVSLILSCNARLFYLHFNKYFSRHFTMMWTLNRHENVNNELFY